jgi:hypothetical protein
MQYYKESEETGQAFSLEDALVHLRDMRAEVKPMLDAHAEMAEADDLAATMDDATVYGQ